MRTPLLDALRGALKTQKEGFLWLHPGKFDRARWEEDLGTRLPEFYGSNGYIDFSVVGDSMVAGCGTPNQAQGLVPNLAARLASTLRRSVAWEALGQLGATMRRVHYRLLPQVDSHPDLLVVCAGSNDVLAGRSTGEWADDLSAVLDMAREPARNVVVLSSGQANHCPALPRVLRREIGRAIDRQTAVSRDVRARRGRS